MQAGGRKSGSGKSEAEEFALQKLRGFALDWQSALPAIPVRGNEAGLRPRVVEPAVRSLFAEKNRESRVGMHRSRSRLAFVEAGGQAFADGFTGIETENPAGTDRETVRGRGGHYEGAILPCNAKRVVLRTVIDDHDIVAGIKHLQTTAEAEAIVLSVHKRGDGWHGVRFGLQSLP